MRSKAANATGLCSSNQSRTQCSQASTNVAFFSLIGFAQFRRRLLDCLSVGHKGIRRVIHHAFLSFNSRSTSRCSISQHRIPIRFAASSPLSIIWFMRRRVSPSTAAVWSGVHSECHCVGVGSRCSAGGSGFLCAMVRIVTRTGIAVNPPLPVLSPPARGRRGGRAVRLASRRQCVETRAG